MRCVLACSRCRQQKIRCIHNGSPPCAYCSHKGCVDECTLTFPPRKPTKSVKKKKKQQENINLGFRGNQEIQMEQNLQSVQTQSNNGNSSIGIDQGIKEQSWESVRGTNNLETNLPAPPMDAIFSAGIIPNIDDEMIRFQSLKNNAHNSMFTSIQTLVNSTPKHYATMAMNRISVSFPEFVFLHPATFGKNIDRINPILVGSLLAACSFFCPLKDTDPQSALFISDRWLGADSFQVKNCLYEKLTMEAIFNNCLFLSKPDLEICQALLFLACVRWGHNEYYHSWMLHGCASRMIQALQFDERFQQKCRQEPLLNELNTRTFWSAFCLDRIISTGENRCFVMSKFQDMVLPIPDNQFLALSYNDGGNNVDAPLDSDLFNVSDKNVSIGSRFNSYGSKSEPNNSTYDIVNRNKSLTIRNFYSLNANERGEHKGREYCYYIKAYCLWGRINEYMMEGGRQVRPTEVPWDLENSVVGKLTYDLRKFWIEFPTEWKWDNFNFNSIYWKDRRKAQLLLTLNCLYYLTEIFCIREYLPFLPNKIKGPCGPTEPPYLPDPPYPTYWVDTARKFFNLLRKLSSILEVVFALEKPLMDSEVHLIANSPFSAFCAFVCAVQCNYGAIFPYMDPDSVLYADTKRNNLSHCSKVMIKILKSREKSCPVTKNWLHMAYKVQELYKHVSASETNKSTTAFNGITSSTNIRSDIKLEEDQPKLGTSSNAPVQIPNRTPKLSSLGDRHIPSTDSLAQAISQIPFDASLITSTTPDISASSNNTQNNVFSPISDGRRDNFFEFGQFKSQNPTSTHSVESSSTSNTPNHITDVRPETDKLSLLFSDQEFEMLMQF